MCWEVPGLGSVSPGTTQYLGRSFRTAARPIRNLRGLGLDLEQLGHGGADVGRPDPAAQQRAELSGPAHQQAWWRHGAEKNQLFQCNAWTVDSDAVS